MDATRLDRLTKRLDAMMRVRPICSRRMRGPVTVHLELHQTPQLKWGSVRGRRPALSDWGSRCPLRTQCDELAAPVGAIPLSVLRADPGGQRACRMLDQSTKSGRSRPDRRKRGDLKRGDLRRQEVEGDLKHLACSPNSLEGGLVQHDGLPGASVKR